MADLKELSAQAGIDYAEAMDRFGGNQTLYLRLSAKFLNDPHFGELESALADDDAETAFRAAHSLKGVTGNLSFARLYDLSCTLSDALRNGDAAAAKAVMPQARQAYDDVIAALKAL